MGFLIPPRPLTKFEIQKYYKNEPRFNGVFSRNNLPKKIKDGACIVNLHEYAAIGTHWIALFCNRNEIIYFDIFGVDHIPKEIKRFINRPLSSALQNKSKHFSSTRKRFNNVWVFLHWIY